MAKRIPLEERHAETLLKVSALRDEGKTYTEISVVLGITRSLAYSLANADRVRKCQRRYYHSEKNFGRVRTDEYKSEAKKQQTKRFYTPRQPKSVN